MTMNDLTAPLGQNPSRHRRAIEVSAAKIIAVALGLFVSFTGILTFKKSEDLRAIARSLPADRILVETDAPYLAPTPYRGRRNEPAYVVETARVLAEVRETTLEAIARQTSDNFFRLFSKVPRRIAAAA